MWGREGATEKMKESEREEERERDKKKSCHS